MENEYTLYISTISIAEFCVVGELTDLPLKNCVVLPFNIKDAEKTGEFASILFKEKNNNNIYPRAIIPNDSKLFAQADCSKTINYFVTSDVRSAKNHKILKENLTVKFEIIDIHQSYGQTFGILNL